MSLIIRTESGDFDLFGNEDIVQTLGIFNFEDISSRTGEYTNMFNLPLTNNNIKLIGHADYLLTVNTVPYQKITCSLIVDELEWRKGLFIIEEVSDVIKARFISGNSNFYSLIKELYLTDLDWSTYDHIWNYANAVSSSANTSGYTYPIIDYNGQTLTGDIVNVRKVLPATFGKTALNKMFEQVGYSAVYNFDDSDLSSVLLPYSKKNPQVSAEVLLLNQVDVRNNIQQPFITLFKELYSGVLAFLNNYTDLASYNTIDTPGSSTNYDFTLRKYTAQYSGNYTINALCELVNYDCISYNFSVQNVVFYDLNCNTYLRILKKSGGTYTVIKSELCAYSNAQYNSTTPPYKNSITGITTTYLTNTTGLTTYLNGGDEIYVQLFISPTINWSVIGTTPSKLYGSFNPICKVDGTLEIDLSPELVFGGLITYSSMLPKIKCSDYFRDICIRYGLIANINEDTKTVTLNKFETIYDNIPNSKNWSDKLDDSTNPIISFKYDSYAQNNNFLHKEDKSIVRTDENANYNLVINNANLVLEKDLYKSPFATCENTIFDTTLTAYINLYDTNTNKFDNDVQPRICYSEIVNGLFKFTDGTSTSGYINARRLWFIDDSLPNLSMGFAFLMPKNSRLLIDTLQNLKLVTVDLNINQVDIRNLDFMMPIYIERLQSYFFIPIIKQYNYTKPKLTEVELIKLNP